MPVYWTLVEPLRVTEAALWCAWLFTGGVVVGWLRWGQT